MRRNLKTALLLLMLALMPLRALAAVTVGDCPAAHHETTGDSTPHPHGDATPDHDHCASASFVPSAELPPLPTQAASDRVAQRERFAAGFVADHLDPPPLAL